VTDETMLDISKAKEIADYALLCFRGPHDEARDNLEIRIGVALLELESKHNRLLDECSDTHKRLVKDHHNELEANYSDSVAKILDIHKESITRLIERVEGLRLPPVNENPDYKSVRFKLDTKINDVLAAIKEELL